MSTIFKYEMGKRGMLAFSLMGALGSVASLVWTWHRDLSGMEIGFIVGLFCAAVSMFLSAVIGPRKLFNEKSRI